MITISKTGFICRRDFLEAIAGTITLGTLSGCTEIFSKNGGRDAPIETPTPVPQPSLNVARNQEIQLTWNRNLDQVEEIPNQHSAFLTVDSDGQDLEELALVLEGENQSNIVTDVREQVQVEEPQLANGENQIYLVEHQDGKQADEYSAEDAVTQPQTITKNIPPGFRIETRNPEGDLLGNWNTVYSFDNLEFNKQAMEQKRMQWNEEMLYNDLLNDLETDSKEIREKYNGNDYGVRFSNHSQPENGNIKDVGNWDIRRFQETKNLHDLLIDSTAALQIHMISTGESDWSTENAYFAANIDKLVNDIYQPENEERIIETTFVDQGGHGTVMAYIDPENSELEAENPWWWVNTTESEVAPIEEAEIDRGYNPFVEGYSGEESLNDRLSYTVEKAKALGPITNFVDRNHGGALRTDKISFSDSVLGFVYNEHVPNGGSADPIIDMAEKAGDFFMDEDVDYVHIYGDEIEANEEGEFEGVRYAAVDDNQLFRQSIKEDTRLTVDEVENHLEEISA